MKVIETLSSVISTLNNVTVCGYDNMNRLMGCMKALDNLRYEIEASKKENTEETAND